MDPSKSKPAADQLSFDVDKGVNCFDTDVELFGMSISTERSEAIEENVDDLVNDLETLLGESTDDFNVPKNSPKSGEESTRASAIQEEISQNATDKVDTTVSSEKSIEEKLKEQNDVVQDEGEQPLQMAEEPIKDSPQVSSIPAVDLENTANQDYEVGEQNTQQDATPESTPEVPQGEADESIEAPEAQMGESDLSSTKDHKEGAVVVSSSHSPLLQSTEQEIPIAEEDPTQTEDKEENITAEISSALTISISAQEEPNNFNSGQQDEEIPKDAKTGQINPHDAEPVETKIVVEEVKDLQVPNQEITEENQQEISAPTVSETEHSKVDALLLHVEEPMQIDDEAIASEETSKPDKEELTIEVAIPTLNIEMTSTDKLKETPEIQADIEMSYAKETIELPTDIEMVSAEEPEESSKPTTDIQISSAKEPKETIELPSDIELVSAEEPKETIELPTDVQISSAKEPKETIELPSDIELVSAEEPKETIKLPTDVQISSSKEPKETIELVSAEEPKETIEPSTEVQISSATEPKETIALVSAEEPKETIEPPTDVQISSAKESKETIELPSDIEMVSAEEPKETLEPPTDVQIFSAKEPKETIELPSDIEMVSAEEPKETIKPPTDVQIFSAKEPKEAIELPSDIEMVSAEELTDIAQPQTDPVVDELPTTIQDTDQKPSDIVQPESDGQVVDLKHANKDEAQSIETVLDRTEDSLQAEENQIQPKEEEIQSTENLVQIAEDVLGSKEVASFVEEAAIDSAKGPEEKPAIEPTEALECITQEAEESKDGTVIQDRVINQPQNGCEALQTSAISMKENIEIEEVTDDFENTEIVEIPAVVEEPEDENPVVQEPKVDREDGIVEITNEQIAQEHLEEIQVEREVASSDQKLSLDEEITNSVVSEGDAVAKTDDSCEQLPDFMLSKVTVSTEGNSQVAKKVDSVEETLTAAKVKEVVKTESTAILESQDEHAEEPPSDNVIADEATIVKTEELSVADKTVSDKIEDTTKPVEHEYVTLQKNAQNLLESAKTKPEIMIRRKTVEQDLEKVVCLSEESSDSDCNGPTSDKPLQDLPALDEDANLIKIATEPDVESINAASNLETLLAVASLQNESVTDTREHRRLSENEIREMEAIRMAVASITDSSQDTYDSFMVENVMTMDNSAQDEQDVQEISNLPAEFIAEDTNIEEIAGNNKTGEDAACATAVVDSNTSLQQSTVKLEEIAENNTPIASTATPVNTDDPDPSTIDDNSQAYEDNIPEGSSNAPEIVKENEDVSSAGAAVKDETPLLANIEQSCVASSTSKSPNPAVEIPEKNTETDKDPEVPTPGPVQILHDPVVIPAVVDEPSEDAVHCEDKPLHKSTDIEEQVAAEIPSMTLNEKNILAADSAMDSPAVRQLVEEKPPRNRSKRSTKISEPLTINVEEVEKKEKVYSPKITIKPLKVPDEEVSTTSEADASKGSLKMTITKQSDKMHSILKLYNPEEEQDMLSQTQEEPIPKLIIKPKLQQVEQQHSPKMTTRSAKVCSPTSTRCSSPRITIKPVTKPAEAKLDVLSPLKITIKPVIKPDDASRKHSPKAVKDADQLKNHNLKITIKPIPRPVEEKEDLRPSTPKLIIKPIPKPVEGLAKEELPVCTPKLTIRALKRPLEETDLDNEPERSSPKITIKPLVKPAEHDSAHQSIQTTPKIKIRPVRKHDDGDFSNEVDREEGSPKISIKPLVKPPDIEPDDDEEVKERIVLKINKGEIGWRFLKWLDKKCGNLPLNKESKKREHPDEDKGEKFSTTGGHTHIVQEKEDGSKRQRKDSGYLSSAEKSKRLRSALTPDNLAESCAVDKLDPKIPYPLAGISEDRSQVSKNSLHSETPDISKIAALAAQTTHIEAPSVVTVGIATPTVTPGPKKRGRPRKVPLKFREDSDATISSPITPQTTPSSDPLTPVGSESMIVEPTSSGGRPKRSCRGQNVMATLGIKPRKPRGRGRGSKVNMGDRGPQTPVSQVSVEITAEVPAKPDKMFDERHIKFYTVELGWKSFFQINIAFKKRSPLKIAEKGAKAKLKFGRKSSEKEILNQDTEAKAKQSPKGARESVGKEGSSQEENTDVDAKTAEATQEHSFEESLKRKCEDSEDHASKKKKDDKTPTRKLEADAAPSSSQPTLSPDTTAIPPPAPYKQPLTEQEKFVELNSKNYPDITITKSKSVPTTAEIPIEEPVEVGVVKPEERLSIDSNSKKETALDEEDDEDLGQDGETIELGDDSESERQREHVLQKKQEAIKKCRAKRMEKLARAAELKRKRQEQAAQQREARKAAEEAERVATEKARATKRYGRYGVPKPQISLIDAPLPESAGTVKSHVVESPTKPANQPASIEDKAEKEVKLASATTDLALTLRKLQPLKNLEGHFTTNKSPQKLLFSEPMVVDAPEESPAKIRRSLAREDVVMVDEETRMSADFRGSRSQTPAKQSAQPADIMVEDSQGSIGTEGGKSRSSKAPKMEVFQDLESAAYSADQLAEYSWNGQGPFMIQEQVTQYLGIKSFKRKYPNMTRRAVDIQERDYLKESGQVTEGQCDLGLTAVAAQDILDIMYADFQDKYEDYCKAQREKQARELANKQKALNQFTLKPGFDKLDILEQAVQSAAAWNSQFNKARREQRRAHMDLQNWSIHYPKSKMKVLPAPKIGHYPIALVPGQFTDYYRDYTPTELNNLPLNTMCYDEIKVSRPPAQSEESSNGSDSDSESSSGSSSSGSSCDDANCKECDKKVKKTKELRETDSDDVVFVENDASSSDSVVLVSVTSAPVTA
ncbi:hypothetical protein D910_09287 [Dendroctonus ponderosae]|uniref:PHD finger protein 10 n=1 Tax=Dendroctonus ponderosae TaxID=77166 RepID=U4UDC3_DENPD|nr:hypothetical protein D910_09287 [Dendroctonus ponderosae]